MDDNFEFLENSEKLPENLEKFEAVVNNNESGYFDPAELEDLIDHYTIHDNQSMIGKCFQYGLSIHPSSAILHLRKGQWLFETGRFKESLNSLRQAESLEPVNIDILLQIAQVYSAITDRHRAIQYLERALGHCVKDEQRDIVMDIASEYQSIGSFRAAANALEDLVQFDPYDAEALYELAFCYDLAEENEQSVKYYKRFLDEEPYSFIAWYNLGNTLCKLKEYGDAVEAFELALAIKDDLGSAAFNKANALVNLERYEEAIESFKDTIEMEGPHATTHTLIGEAYEKLGEHSKALEHYLIATQIDTEYASAWLGIGIVKDLQGKSEEAILFLERAVENDSKNDSHWIVLGNACEKSGDFIKSEYCYRKALQLNETESDAFIDLSNLLFDLNKYEEAIEIVRRGLEACTEHKDILQYRLITCLLAKGSKLEAFTEIRAAGLDKSSYLELLEAYPELNENQEIKSMIDQYSER